MKNLSAIAICLGIFAGALGAQTAAPPAAPAPPASSEPTFKVGGEEVVLDVVVRDKKGRLVKDLKQSDFSVTDNGQTHPVKSFRLVEGADAISSSGARSQLDPLRQIRLVTLIFQGLDQNGNKLSRDAALSLIKSELGPNVFISVLTIDHRLQAIQTFTNNRDLLKKAIERATSGANDYTSDTLQVRAQLQTMIGAFQGGDTSQDAQVANMNNGASASGGAGASPSGGAAANQAMAQMMLQIVNTETEDTATDYGRQVIFALLDAVKEQYRLPGRKTILYFSPGFTVPQGMEAPFDSVISIANRSNVSFYAIDARGLTTTDTNKGAIDMLNGAVAASKANALNRNGVTTDMAHSDDKSLESGRADSQNTLLRMAKATGGDLFANTNDFRGPIRRLNEDIETYYEISYDPEITNYDGSMRKVSVKTDQADLKVQSRSFYFALPPSLTAGGKVVAPYEVPLLKALDTKPLPRTFAFHSSGMHFRDSSGASECDVVMDVPISSLTVQEDKPTNSFNVRFAYVAIVKDSKGEIVKKFNNEVPFHMPADKVEDFKKQSHYMKAESFDLPPGRYTLDAAVVDMLGEKISTRRSSFMVPVQDKTLSISSVAVVRNMKAADKSVKPNDPLVMDNQVITPDLNPVVKKSADASVPFYVVIYSDKTNTEKPALRMVFSKDGQELGGGSAPLGPADAQGRIQYVATAPIAKFEPGDYQVRFIAQQGKEAAIESVTFKVEP